MKGNSGKSWRGRSDLICCGQECGCLRMLSVDLRQRYYQPGQRGGLTPLVESMLQDGFARALKNQEPIRDIVLVSEIAQRRKVLYQPGTFFRGVVRISFAHHGVE